MYKVSMVSLGCPKNQVDAEQMLYTLQNAGFELTPAEADADAIIINTCGFIESAKAEAIENILEAAKYKDEGKLKALIVTGCLAERYQNDVTEEIPEVDVCVGIGSNGKIAEIVKNAIEGKCKNSFGDKCDLDLNAKRILGGAPYTAYLKVADGCNNCCTYCAIPSIRGPFRSRPIEEIVNEAEGLAVAGVREIIVVAQDTTRYGEDIYGELKLPELLNQLCEIQGIEWIRLFYCYPDRITDELLETMAKQEKILHYIDLPLQHADGNILKKMNRTGDVESLTALINKIRDYMPDAVIRTTFITGFPGEGEKEFEVLAQFVKDMKFDRLGCFAYSPQEGTPACEFKDEVDDETKIRRGEVIMDEQYRVVEEKNEEIMGREFDVLIEGYDDYTDCYYGRSYMDAPEIDTMIYFSSPNGYSAGDFTRVVVFDRDEYDLIGKEVEDF